MSENQWDSPDSKDKDMHNGWEREAIEKLAFCSCYRATPCKTLGYIL